MTEEIKAFQNEFEEIADDSLRSAVIKFFDEEVPIQFWKASASSTGKYHPKLSLGEGGLVRHTKMAVKIAVDFLATAMFKSIRLEKDEIIAALLIHDTFKHGLPWGEYTSSNHPRVASNKWTLFAKKNGVNEYKLQNIAKYVIRHMGEWNRVYEDGFKDLPKPQDQCSRFVHMCDYIASRKWFEDDYSGEDLN